MVGRGSPRLNMLLSHAAQKKPSPKTRKTGCSPKEKVRAFWNPSLEKTLVDLLHEYKTPDHRGQNGWPSESWNKIVREFHKREDYVSFTKAQIQEKEKELKRDYRLLKDAKQQSGVHFDEKAGRITAEAAIWKNILDSYPKAKKFRNKGFPLFETLGELYDGQIAQGTYNYTSNQPKDLEEVENETMEVLNSDLQEMAGQDNEDVMILDDDHVPETRDPNVTRNTEDDLRIVDSSQRTSREEREPKRLKRNNNLEGVLARYMTVRTKQAEEESAQLAREKEKSEEDAFSIKKCISVLGTMEVTKEEKAKSYKVFKDPDNRQIFLSACDDDQEATLIWLRSEFA